MKVKTLLPQVNRRLRREYKLTGLSQDSLSLKEDTRRYDSCLVYQSQSVMSAVTMRKVAEQKERDKRIMSLGFARAMS